MLKMNGTWWRRGLLAVLLVALAVGIKMYFFPAAVANNYITAAVTKGDIETTVLATGTVKAFKQVAVGAQVSGQVKTLKVQLGQEVKKGDVIAEIDARTQKNTLLTEEAQLTNYNAALTAKQASLAKAQLDFTRQATMLKEGASSKENYDAAQATLKVAKADVVQAQAQIKQAKLSADSARLTLSYTQVVAPIDGEVVTIAVEEGQTVNAVQSTPTIVTLAQLDKVTVRAEISEGDVTKVKAGMPAYFTILGDSVTRYETTLASVDPGPVSQSDNTSTASSASTAIYYYGQLHVPNPERTLRADMTTNVSIILDQAKQVLMVPSTALGDKNDKGQYRVQVLDKDKKTSERWITVGLNNNINAQVIDGLTEGEQVVVSQVTTAASSASKKTMGGGPPMGM